MFLDYIKAPLSIIKYHINKKKKIKYTKFSSLHPDEERYVKELKKNGIVVIENFISKEKCQKIKKIIDDTMEKFPEKLWKDDLESDQRIQGAEILDKDILDFFNNQFIKRIGEKYCGYKIKTLMTMAGRIQYKKGNVGSGGGWHKDAYFNQFKSIVYLNDVTNVNGPFEMLRNSEKLFNSLIVAMKLKKKYPNLRFEENEIKKVNFLRNIKFLAKAGTLILVNVSSIHRGSPLFTSKRYVLMNYHYPADVIDDYKNAHQPRFSFN